MDHDDGKPSASGSTACDTNGTPQKWIHLSDRKEFSRLLYPNPVCFLTSSDNKDESSGASKRRNVMVLSWLTATDNSGRFLFSINRNRHSALNIVPIDESSGKARTGVDFVLSCPVQGMEQLVLDVGGTSGKWGSKFMADRNHDDADPSKEIGEGDVRRADVGLHVASMSDRQKKKLKRMRMAKGVPNLEAVPIGHLDNSAWERNALFAINGTCAHIHCRTSAIVDEPATGIVDEEQQHHLVMAEVIDARVDSSYWDAAKRQFRPMREDVPPYLTFFGAQTFGYVRNR
mmetsp:Transcript_25623/g.74129  ORF Transcript_25623/g.74129 Transcript_25623/m.74129 type:complete len:288 (+) Transcript_25623:181-1044(+)